MSLPITEIGVGGVFAVILIDRVLGWAIKIKNNGKDKMERLPCIYSPEAKAAMLNNILMKEAMGRMEKHMEGLSKETSEQTGILERSLEKLKEIAKNSKS